IPQSNVDAVNRALDAFQYRGPQLSTGEFTTGYTTTNLFGRVDGQAATGTRVEFRYSLYDVASPNARGVGGLSDVSRGSRLDDRDQTFAASLLSSGSSAVVNEARAQYTRSRLGAPVNDLVGPAMTISGVANFGTATSSPTARDLDVYEAADTLTLQ